MTSTSARLRLVPPGGKYVAPFYFAAYYTSSGGGPGEQPSMLFSPHSSSPSGHYEGGGLGNLRDPADPILHDCKLLLTVSEVNTRESIISAQEAPLGRKVQLPSGQYHVSAQLLSFGGHTFASAEAQYEVVDAFETRPDGSYRYTGEGTSSSALFDTLANVQRNGGLPSGKSPARGTSSPAPSEGPRGVAAGRGPPPTPHRSPSGPALSDHIAATVRQSEEALQHAVSHFGAAAAESAGRLSRQSSMDSRSGQPQYGQLPQQSRPPLGKGPGAGPPPASDGEDRRQHAQHSAVPDATAHHDLHDTTTGDDGAAGAGRSFLVPPPSVLLVGAPLLVVLKPQRTGDAGARVVNALVQEERRGVRAAPRLTTVSTQRIHNIAVAAKGVQLHWFSHRATAGGPNATQQAACNLTPHNRGTQLQLELPAASSGRHGAQSSSSWLSFSAVASSEESFGPTGPDGVLCGIQMCVGPQSFPRHHHPQATPASSMDEGPIGELHILVSVRPQRQSQYGSRMPYLDIQRLPPASHRAGGGFLDDAADRNFHVNDVPRYNLTWKVSGVDAPAGDAPPTQLPRGGVVHEANITAHDVLALYFSDDMTGGGRDDYLQPAAPPPVYAVLAINYEPVARVLVPAEAAREFSASAPLHLSVITHVQCTSSWHRSGPPGMDVLRSVRALSHYTTDGDVLHVQGDDLFSLSSSAAEGAHHRRVLYLWEAGDALSNASRHEVLVVPSLPSR